MGEGSDELRNDEATPPVPEESPPNVCSNCQTINDIDARLCKVCFAPLSAALTKICPNCMTPNQESAHLCRTCMTPLSAHATIDPIFGISARGDTFSKAAGAPRKPIVLIGMWLLFGPVALILSLGILGTAGFTRVLIAAVDLLPILILVKTTSNYLKGPPPTERGGFPVVEDKSQEPDEAVAEEADDQSNTDDSH